MRPDTVGAVTPGPDTADERLRAELGRAFQQLRPQMVDNAFKDADLDPNNTVEDFSRDELEQFANAYEAMFTEALEGTGDETRRFIFDTALPPMVERGQSALDMIRSNVVSAVMSAHRLLPLVDAELRDDAARWLADFHATYAREVAERAIALEAERR
jgi:hypothetical protein